MDKAILDTPLIRIQLDRAIREIVFAVSEHDSTLKERLEAAAYAAIKNFDINAEVDKQVSSTLKSLVGEAVSELFSYEFKDELREKVKEMLYERINRK